MPAAGPPRPAGRAPISLIALVAAILALALAATSLVLTLTRDGAGGDHDTAEATAVSGFTYWRTKPVPDYDSSKTTVTDAAATAELSQLLADGGWKRGWTPSGRDPGCDGGTTLYLDIDFADGTKTALSMPDADGERCGSPDPLLQSIVDFMQGRQAGDPDGTAAGADGTGADTADIPEIASFVFWREQAVPGFDTSTTKVTDADAIEQLSGILSAHGWYLGWRPSGDEVGCPGGITLHFNVTFVNGTSGSYAMPDSLASDACAAKDSLLRDLIAFTADYEADAAGAGSDDDTEED